MSKQKDYIIMATNSKIYRRVVLDEIDCPKCDGDGWIDNEICPDCLASGRTWIGSPVQDAVKQALRDMLATGELRALLTEAGVSCHTAARPIKVRG